MSLTEDSLYFSKPDDDQILDFIPLIEVTKFELVANDGQEDKKSAFAKSFRGSISMKRLDSATGSETDDNPRFRTGGKGIGCESVCRC